MLFIYQKVCYNGDKGEEKQWIFAYSNIFLPLRRKKT